MTRREPSPASRFVVLGLDHHHRPSVYASRELAFPDLRAQCIWHYRPTFWSRVRRALRRVFIDAKGSL